MYHCQLFLSLIFSLVFHSFFLTNTRSFSLSISLISYVVVEMTFLTVILVNLIPLSLFFTVFNFSPLSLPLFLSPYFFTGLWAPQGTLFMWPHPSVSTKHATHAHTQTHKWKHSWSPNAPGGHELDYTLCSDSAQWLCTLTVTHTSCMHRCIVGIKSCTFCSLSLTPRRSWSTHTLLVFSHLFQI